MWFLIPVEKWNFILFALLYLKKMGEKLHLLPGEFRHQGLSVNLGIKLLAFHQLSWRERFSSPGFSSQVLGTD